VIITRIAFIPEAVDAAAAVTAATATWRHLQKRHFSDVSRMFKK